MATEEIAHLIALKKENTKRLRVLELQQARYGKDCPPHIVVEIEDIREKIEEVDRIMVNISSDEKNTSAMASATNNNEMKVLAGTTLIETISSVFVDTMRMLYVVSSNIAYRANVARYAEFINIAKRHFDDLRSLLVRYTVILDADLYNRSVIIERRLSWMLAQLEPLSKRSASNTRYFRNMNELSNIVDEFCLNAAHEFYSQQRGFIDSVVKGQFLDFEKQISLMTCDQVFMSRMQIQTAVLNQNAQSRIPIYSIADDLDQSLAVLYFLIDRSMLRHIHI